MQTMSHTDHCPKLSIAGGLSKIHVAVIKWIDSLPFTLKHAVTTHEINK